MTVNGVAPPAEVRDRLVGVISDAMGGWAENLADTLIASATAGAPTLPSQPPAEQSGPGPAVLWDALQILAWLHAELAHKHTQLVAEINGMVQQAMGPTGMDTQRLQEFRQRAARIARFRTAQQQGGQQP